MVAESFIRREVQDEEAVGTRGLGIADEFFVAIDIDRVQVSEENDWGGVSRAEVLEVREEFREGGARGESMTRSRLDGWAICEGVGERDSDFQDVGTGIRDGGSDRKRAREVRVTAGDVSDESFAVLLAEAFECRVDTVLHTGR